MSINLTQISNGLKIATEYVDNIESIAINITIKVGSRNEIKDLNGITHFLEHMAFKGTLRRNSKEIAEEFDSIGGYFNAYTSREFTTYTVKILKEHILTAVDILADIIQYSVFLDEEIAKERNVIIQEIAATNDAPDDIIFDVWHEQAFSNQAIGRSILGSEKIISNFDSNIIKDYVSKYYTANNMIISLVGKLDHDKIIQYIEEKFDNLKLNNESYLEKSIYTGGSRFIKRDLEQAHLVTGFQGCNYLSNDFYSINMLSTILGGGMSSRLFQEIREKRGLAYSVGSFFNSYSDNGVFGVYVAAEDEKLPEIVNIINNEIQDLSANISLSEYDRALTQLRSSLLISQESSSSRASDISKSFMIYGRYIPVNELIEKLYNVTKTNIKEFTEKMLKSDSTISLISNKNILDI